METSQYLALIKSCRTGVICSSINMLIGNGFGKKKFQRVKFFIWLVAHQKIMTNVERKKRSLVENDMCNLCKEEAESVLHVLRDCKEAKEVRRCVCQDSLKISEFWTDNLLAWIRIGIRDAFRLKCPRGKGVFAAAIWSIWKRRCKAVMEGEKTPAGVTARIVTSLSRRWEEAQESTQTHKQTSVLNIKWVPPSRGKMKLNTDGAVDIASGMANGGGILRDEDGNWVMGFVINIGKADVLAAEIWALREGLRLAKIRCSTHLEAEVDCLALTELIKKDNETTHPLSHAVLDCKQLMLELGISEIKHTYRESNKCADHLAKLGRTSIHGLSLLEVPPRSILPLLWDDGSGVESSRIVSLRPMG